MKRIIIIMSMWMSGNAIYAQTTPTTSANGTFSSSPSTNGAILNTGSNSGVNPAGNPGTIKASSAMSNQSGMPTPPPNTAGIAPQSTISVVNGTPVINTLPNSQALTTVPNGTTVQYPLTTVPNTITAVPPVSGNAGAVPVSTITTTTNSTNTTTTNANTVKPVKTKVLKTKKVVQR